MDGKALAKSKRAHSLHHSKKHHPNPKLKPPLAGPDGAKKPSGKQVREKSHLGSSGLPSNWDRYEEEDLMGSVDPSHASMVHATDVIVPKSKGADYSHLISEAKAQSQMKNSSESFPSIDDVLADFNQGFSDLLSVRGQGILSRTGDDNFIVEDRATSSHEASFLSLNLHRLAEQLSKVDLSQRLFIEADFIPPEMCTEELKTSLGQESDWLEPASQSEEGMKENSDKLLVHGCQGRNKVEDQTSEFMPPVSSGIRDSVSTSCFQGLKSTDQAKNELSQSGGTSENIGKYRAQSNVSSVANPEKKSSRFEVAAAEAELDMLINSFSETTLSDSSSLTKKSGYSFSDQEETSSRFEGNSFLKQAPLPQPPRKEPDLSKPTSLATNFDDALDDLLNGTSSGVTFSVPQEGTSTSLLRGIPSLQSAPGQPLRNGPDLSYKSTSVMANFDDALDNLLKETSNLTNQRSTSQSHEVMPAHLKTMSSASSGPAPKSKALDVFDSWFDKV